MKNLSLLILVFGFFCINSIPLEAQSACSNRGFRFKVSKFIETIDTPKQVVVADFNKDGNQDFANLQITNPIQNNFRRIIEIYLGNGRGEFAVSSAITLDYVPSFYNEQLLRTADFNGDGNVDMCLTQLGQIKIWLGDGKAGFGAARDYPLNSEFPSPAPSSAIAIADVNGDGRSDVMFSNTSLYVLLASADGSLSVPKVQLLGSQITLFATSDLNGDGKPELVGGSVNGENNFYIFSNQGDGKFSTPAVINVAFPPGQVIFGDFNGDQKTDIIVTTPTNAATSILLNNGNGGFTTTKLLFTRGFTGIVPGDFNKDGKLDFAFTQNSSSNSGYLSNFGIYLGDGSGNFPSVLLYMVGVSPQSLFVTDFNKDGFQDFLIQDTNGIDFAFGEANGKVTAAQFVASESPGSFGGKFVTGNLNKDLIPDILTIGSTNYIFEGRGNGEYKTPTAIDGSKYKLAFQNTAAIIADLNKDGDADIGIIGNYVPSGGSFSNRTLTILYGNSTGGFAETDVRTISLGQSPRAIKAVDLNSDGFLDLVITNSDNHTVTILKNIRNNQFAPALNLSTGLDPQTLTSGDFNGDNLTDIVIGNRSSAGFTLFINDGAGGFTSSLIGIAANPGQLQAYDINLDGKQDLIIAQANANTLTVMLGNGNGTFGTRMNMTIPGRINDFVLTDINQDGKIDLIATFLTIQINQFPIAQNRFAIFVGEGTGKFNFVSEAMASQAGNLSINDLNGDSVPDLVVAGQYGVQIFSGICNSSATSLGLTAVNAAGYAGFDVSPEGIVAAFGSGFSSSTLLATTIPLPLQLGGTVAKVKDSKGVERTAPLFFVSPGQVNLQIPIGTELGIATISINNGDGIISSGEVLITVIKPGIFTANSDGSGVVAANALRFIEKTKTQVSEPVARYDDLLKRFVPSPLFLPSNVLGSDSLYLILYGTGIRGRSSLEGVRVYVGGVAFNVDYAGSHCCFIGVDQINVRIYDNYSIPRGEVDVRVEVDGKLSNIGKVILE